jgi:hypothetical protein
MRVVAATIAALAIVAAQSAAAATTKHPHVMRTASGTVIQPSKIIIHGEDGRTRVIVIPRRSYLDTGTEVSVGDRSFRDYVFPPNGDPGRSNWFIGPDTQGSGGYPLPRPLYIPGLNPDTPF